MRQKCVVLMGKARDAKVHGQGVWVLGASSSKFVINKQNKWHRQTRDVWLPFLCHHPTCAHRTQGGLPVCDYPMISGAHALQHTVVPRRGGLGAAVDTFTPVFLVSRSGPPHLREWVASRTGARFPSSMKSSLSLSLSLSLSCALMVYYHSLSSRLSHVSKRG